MPRFSRPFFMFWLDSVKKSDYNVKYIIFKGEFGVLWQLFFTFFKIGLFTFGGGYAMIANIREVVVAQHGWLDDDELLEIITVAESTPGPIAINLATYVGYRRRGVLGSVLATLGVVLPSLIIIFTVSLFLDAFMANKYVAYAFVGVKCAVALLILRAGLAMLRKIKKRPLPLTLFGVVFVLMLGCELLALSFRTMLAILVGGVIGILSYLVAQMRKKGGAA